MDAGDGLDDAAIERYARHIVLKEIGGIGQSRLLRARVLVIGAGGLGSPLLLYLAAAGVGTLGIVDDDRVQISNLHRQIAHDEAFLGRLKTESAAARLHAVNPTIGIEIVSERLHAANAASIVEGYDLIADGSDSFETRACVHDAALGAKKTLVSASVQALEGQLTVFKAHLGEPHPCLHCLFPDEPAPRMLPSCAQGGVLGPAAGVMGSLQAVEVVKELLGPPLPSLSGRLLLYDALGASIEQIAFNRRRDCPHHRPGERAARSNGAT